MMVQSGHFQALGHLSQRRHIRQELRGTNPSLLFVSVLSLVTCLVKHSRNAYQLHLYDHGCFYQSFQVDQIDVIVDFLFHSFLPRAVAGTKHIQR